MYVTIPDTWQRQLILTLNTQPRYTFCFRCNIHKVPVGDAVHSSSFSAATTAQEACAFTLPTSFVMILVMTSTALCRPVKVTMQC